MARLMWLVLRGIGESCSALVESGHGCVEGGNGLCLVQAGSSFTCSDNVVGLWDVKIEADLVLRAGSSLELSSAKEERRGRWLHSQAARGFRTGCRVSGAQQERWTFRYALSDSLTGSRSQF